LNAARSSEMLKVIHLKYYKHFKKLFSRAIWADKKGLLSGRLASKKIEFLNNIVIVDLSFEFSIQLP
jgi:hypothetical protein